MFCFCFGNAAFTARCQIALIEHASKAVGMGGLTDAGAWGLAWATLAAVAGLGLAAVAATALWRRFEAGDPDFLVGYDALEPMMRREEA
jgi:hypothetical protein